MHIPDNYLSPATCAVMGAAMVPVWALAMRHIKKELPKEKIPLLGIGARGCIGRARPAGPARRGDRVAAPIDPPQTLLCRPEAGQRARRRARGAAPGPRLTLGGEALEGASIEPATITGL